MAEQTQSTERRPGRSTPEILPKDRWWHPILTVPLRCIGWVFRTAPSSVVYGLADLVALGLWPFGSLRDRAGQRSGGFHRNVRVAFRNAPRPKGFSWRNVRHLTWLAVDLARMPRVRADNLAQHVDLSELEQLRPLLDREGRAGGILCVTGHIGSPEYLGHSMALLGHNVLGVYAPSPIPGITRIGERLRSAGGQRLVDPRGVMWGFKKALDRGELVGVAADTSNKTTHVFAPFLGTMAATAPLPSHLHLITGKPITVCTMERTGRMKFRFRVWDVIEHPKGADRDVDILAIATRINDALSRAILDRPEQWFWHARRFRRRPPSEQALPDGMPPTVDGPHPSFWGGPHQAP